MADQVKARITAIYSDLFQGSDHRLDPKMLNYWVVAVSKGDKTYADFMSFVLDGTDYGNYKRSMFMDTFYELASCLPPSADAQAMYDDLSKSFEGITVTRQHIRNVLARTPEFESECARIVNKLYEAVHGEPASNDTTRTYLQKFADDNQYTLETLHRDITQQASAPSSQPNTTIAFTPASVQTEDTQKCIEFYERVMERSMNAREYLEFAPQLTTLATNEKALMQRLQDIKAELHNAQLQVQEVVYKYLALSLTTDEFIKHHMHRALSEAAYDRALVEELVDSSEYEIKMKSKLCELHKTLYDEDLVEDDVECLFERLRAQRTELVNEDLNRHLQDFKDETDDYIQRIFNVYLTVYEREPDDDELAEHIKFIRNHDKTEEALEEIKASLRHALEYHDVLKRKIKKALIAKGNSNPTPSAVYKALEYILVHKSEDDIDAKIVDYLSTKF